VIAIWINIILLTMLAICVVTDIKSRKIYNIILFPVLLLALVLNVITGGLSGLAAALIGFATGLGILLIPYLMGGMGAGDVKLLAVIGALKGTGFVFDASIYMALVGACIALWAMLFHRETAIWCRSVFYFIYGLKHGMRIPIASPKGALTMTYPYGVAIACGALIALAWEGGLLR
jgi:prepilin peptidase CpaA